MNRQFLIQKKNNQMLCCVTFIVFVATWARPICVAQEGWVFFLYQPGGIHKQQPFGNWQVQAEEKTTNFNYPFNIHLVVGGLDANFNPNPDSFWTKLENDALLIWFWQWCQLHQIASNFEWNWCTCDAVLKCTCDAVLKLHQNCPVFDPFLENRTKTALDLGKVSQKPFRIWIEIWVQSHRNGLSNLSSAKLPWVNLATHPTAKPFQETHYFDSKTQKPARKRGLSTWNTWEAHVREFEEMVFYENYLWVKAVLVFFLNGLSVW